MTREEMQKLVAAKSWYHGFDILPGLRTNGKFFVDAKSTLDIYGVPADLTGRTALEIGVWDGPYTFELERRGASVTALDIQDPNRTGFNTAKRILESKVKYIRLGVHEIPADWSAQFDLVLYLGVYYHLRNPIGAFDKLWRVLKSGGDIFYEGACLDYAYVVDPLLKRRRRWIKQARETSVALFAGSPYCGDSSNWFIPTHLCLQEWIRTSGFRLVHDGINKVSSRSWGHAVKDGDFRLEEHAII